MLRVIELNEEDVVLDFNSIKGKEVTNFEPRELLSWSYDEQKEKGYVEIDVDFAFADEPDRYHWFRVIQYAGEEEFHIKMIELIYDGGWIHRDFDFSKKEIEENPILSDLAEKILKRARLPIVTGVNVPETPPFCPTCKQPLEGWQANNHNVDTCRIWSLRRLYGFVEQENLMQDGSTLQDAENKIKKRLLAEEGYLNQVIQYGISEKHIKNLQKLRQS